MNSTRTKTIYIEPRDDGRPCQSLAQLANEVAENACLDMLATMYSGLNSYPGPGRQKVRITITVEAV